MMNDWGMGWGSGGMWFGPLFVVGLGVLAIFATAYDLRSNNDRSRPAIYAQTPREILDERFAKGEIGSEEYSARRNALTSS